MGSLDLPIPSKFITSFLLHIRRRTADVAVDPAPGAATPAGSPDGAGADMVQKARPTVAGDEETYGDRAPGVPSRQEGPRPHEGRRNGTGPRPTLARFLVEYPTLPMAYTPPPSLTTRPGDVSAADTTPVLRRPLAVTNAPRRMNMNHNHHSPRVTGVVLLTSRSELELELELEPCLCRGLGAGAGCGLLCAL